MAGQNGLLFSKVPRHRSAVYLRIEQSSQLKQEFFIIFQCPLDGEQFKALGTLFCGFNGSIFTIEKCFSESTGQGKAQGAAQSCTTPWQCRFIRDWVPAAAQSSGAGRENEGTAGRKL